MADNRERMRKEREAKEREAKRLAEPDQGMLN